MTDAPPPFVSLDVDLHGFSGFMLDVDRLLASELVALAGPEECWAAVMLWCRAWQQTPPASLPNDERALAAFSGAGKRWPKVRTMALRGFTLCSDGRLYHKTLAAEALRAWKKREKYTADQARLKRWREQQRNGDETPPETYTETHFNDVSSVVSEREETVTGTVTGTLPKPNGLGYAFAGKLIRLKPDQFENWQKTYDAIPDIRAELTSLDDFYDRELTGDKRKKWFVRCSSALAKKHQEWIGKRRQANGQAGAQDSW